MLTIAPLEARGVRSLGRFSLHPYDSLEDHAYWDEKYNSRPTHNNPPQENLLPPLSGRFSRFFALRGKVAGLLAPGEALRASCSAGGELVEDTDRLMPEHPAAADTAAEVRFDFAPPLPALQPTDTVTILSRRYVVARLEYTLSAHGQPLLTGYFYPCA